MTQNTPQGLQLVNFSGHTGVADGGGLTVTAKRSATRGSDGFADVGSLNATGLDLGAVAIRATAAGNVTIPPNHEVPTTGQVVECRYLYAFRESGNLYQPVYLGVRDDITGEECTTAQLKYKAAEPAQEAA